MNIGIQKLTLIFQKVVQRLATRLKCRPSGMCYDHVGTACFIMSIEEF